MADSQKVRLMSQLGRGKAVFVLTQVRLPTPRRTLQPVAESPKLQREAP